VGRIDNLSGAASGNPVPTYRHKIFSRGLTGVYNRAIQSIFVRYHSSADFVLVAFSMYDYPNTLPLPSPAPPIYASRVIVHKINYFSATWDFT
jgi:hypothetical protein